VSLLQEPCSYCKKPKPLMFRLVVNQDGRDTAERFACFPCLSEIGEKEMAEHRKAQQTQLEKAETPSNVHELH